MDLVIFIGQGPSMGLKTHEQGGMVMKIMTEWDVTRENDMQNLEGRKALCPFVHAPFEECYCASTSSLFAEATIRYCGGDFKDCAIYLKHAAERTCRQ